MKTFRENSNEFFVERLKYTCIYFHIRRLLFAKSIDTYPVLKNIQTKKLFDLTSITRTAKSYVKNLI